MTRPAECERDDLIAALDTIFVGLIRLGVDARVMALNKPYRRGLCGCAERALALAQFMLKGAEYNEGVALAQLTEKLDEARAWKTSYGEIKVELEQAQEEIADARKALGEHSKHEIGQTLKGAINNLQQILSLAKEEIAQLKDGMCPNTTCDGDEVNNLTRPEALRCAPVR